METLNVATTGRAIKEAKEQAEILLAALRRGATSEGDFLVAHAQHLLACCREIADARIN